MADYADLEVAVSGWEAIAKQLGCHRVTACKKKRELEQAGVIFYRRGRCNKKIVHHFPSKLRAWTSLKGARSEII